jgi:hypothetical protein
MSMRLPRGFSRKSLKDMARPSARLAVNETRWSASPMKPAGSAGNCKPRSRAIASCTGADPASAVTVGGDRARRGRADAGGHVALEGLSQDKLEFIRHIAAF